MNINNELTLRNNIENTQTSSAFARLNKHFSLHYYFFLQSSAFQFQIVTLIPIFLSLSKMKVSLINLKTVNYIIVRKLLTSNVISSVKPNQSSLSQ